MFDPEWCSYSYHLLNKNYLIIRILSVLRFNNPLQTYFLLYFYFIKLFDKESVGEFIESTVHAYAKSIALQ